MATDNKILWFGAGALTVILLARYYNKKKPVVTSDIKNTNPGPINVSIEPNPVTSVPVGSASPLTSGPVTVNALGSGLKRPIYVSPENLVPNIFDRGVGDPVYMNATGGEYTNIQQACKCSNKKEHQQTILSQFNF